MTDLGHWRLTEGLEFRPDAMGFVYIVTHNISGKFYIGKKMLISNRKLKPLAGKTKARRVVKESDWKTYTTSSTTINELIKQDGKDNFTFTILEFHNSKSCLSYGELMHQIKRDVLRNPLSWNGIINVRLSKLKDS